MSESKIYEIAQMIQNKSIVENDLNEAINLVSTMFQEKYINRMYSAITEKHLSCCENPPKEVHLLNALKPFMPESGHQQIDQAVDMLLFASTLNNIQAELPIPQPAPAPLTAASAAPKDNIETAIHDDGIYEIDSKCMLNKQNNSNDILPMVLLMAMQGIFK